MALVFGNKLFWTLEEHHKSSCHREYISIIIITVIIYITIKKTRVHYI